MHAPPLPAEAARLAAVRACGLLDTAPEAEFDRIAFLAAQLFDAPVALVALMDERRLWFKARHGLDLAEVPRAASFCNHTLAAGEALVVPDLLADARYAGHPAASGAGGNAPVRFYAGVPLLTPEGHALGTVCVADPRPRAAVSAGQRQALGHLAALVMDALALRRAAEENRRLAAAVAHLNLGVVMADPRVPGHPLTHVNDAFERVTGYGRAEALGRNCRFLQGPETDPAAVAQMRAAVAARLPYEGTLLNYRKDGTAFWNAVKLSPVRDGAGECVSYVGLQADVTEQRAARLLRREKEAAEQASAAKGEFLSRLSHELRTPLNAILGFGQILEDSPACAPERAAAGEVLAAGRRLLRLVDHVLDLTGAEEGRLALASEPVPLDDLLREAVGLTAPLAEPNGITVALALPAPRPPAQALADRPRLRQALLALLANAVQYNRPGGRVMVDVALLPGGRRARVRVADTGSGVPAALRARLFTPFDRLGAEAGPAPGAGLGLGLALARRLAEAMGGGIGCEDETAAGGAVFWIEVPLAAPFPGIGGAGAEASAWPPDERLPAGATLLYIEDNPPNLQLVERLLAKQPEVSLLSATRAEAGLALARERRPDLILLDLQLPDLPGEEVLVRLHADAGTRGIPVVVVSADATARQIARLRAGGAAAYLTKPFDVHHFLRVVRRAMEEKDEG